MGCAKERKEQERVRACNERLAQQQDLASFRCERHAPHGKDYGANLEQAHRKLQVQAGRLAQGTGAQEPSHASGRWPGKCNREAFLQ